jgi:polysaccharide biosynthesis/export protein
MRTRAKIHGSGLFCCLLLVLCQMFSFSRSAVAADIIGPDDVIRISVYGYDDLKTEMRVSSDGRITFPLIGEVLAKGKSSIELEETIATKLIEGGFIHNAQVSVVVVERVSQQVSVLGYVNKPGRYSLESDTSLLDMIAMAGGVVMGSGPLEGGDNKAIVTRTIDGKTQKFEVDLQSFWDNPDQTTVFKLQKGDLVYIPKAPVFYIYGEVQRPGGYRLESGLTVMKALSIGGGLTLRGTESDTVIKRKDENGVVQEIEVDASAEVQKEDVIYIQERWF